MIRAVFDTNVLISALLFGGLPELILQLAFLKRFKLVTSPVLLDELLEKLRQKFKLSEDRIARTEIRLNPLWDIVSTVSSIRVVAADPDDNRVLEAASAGRADFIVTGDHHLLDLGAYQGIRIITVRQFMDIFAPAS